MATPNKVKIKTEIKLEDAKLDAHTLAYVEYITSDLDDPNNRPKGQAALDKYLSYVGWYECHVSRRSRRSADPLAHRKQRSLTSRLNRLKRLAALTTWR